MLSLTSKEATPYLASDVDDLSNIPMQLELMVSVLKTHSASPGADSVGFCPLRTPRANPVLIEVVRVPVSQRSREEIDPLIPQFIGSSQR